MKPDSLLTLIPAKPFAESKTRLGEILSNAERAALSRTLLQRTIQTALKIGPVAVISRSYKVREAAKNWGAWSLVESESGLNPAIQQGMQWAKTKGVRAVLILPLDLPLLTENDLRHLAEVGLKNAPNIVIAPCHHHSGTNALLLNPPGLISPQFGPNSFRAHQKAARRINIEPQIVIRPGLAFDLDTPADWQNALKQQFDGAWPLQ